MSPRARLVALDLDGTTLNRQGEITPGVKEAIRRAKLAGVRVVLATGRPLVEARPPWEELGGEGPLIVCSGALVADPEKGEELFSHALPETEIWGWVDFLERRELDVLACVLPLVGEDLYLWREPCHPATRDFLAGKDARIKKIARGGRMPPVGRLAALGGKRAVRASVRPGGKIAYLGNGHDAIGILEVTHPGADKGNALACLARQWGIERETVVAIGDHYNDLGMFEYAGTSVAMGNAPPEVAARADLVTSSNAEEGVAKALDLLNIG